MEKRHLLVPLLGLGIQLHRSLRRWWRRREMEKDLAVCDDRIVRLGERRYHVHMRGRYDDKPILFFLHGGPAVPLAPFAHVFQLPLEEHFICVHWDQFASGKSYGLNLASAPITFDETMEDVDAMVTFLCRLFKQDRLILCGFSWGSIPGLEYARIHPERLDAYVGVGQCINHRRELDELVREALHAARCDGDEAAISRLMRFSEALDADKTLASRILHPERLRRSDKRHLLNVLNETVHFVASPYYSLWDGRHFLAAQLFHQRNLLRYMTARYDADAFGRHFHCPLVFISGADDDVIPPRLITAYAEHLDAPYRRMRTLSGVGHNIFLEAPKRSVAMLLREIHLALAHQQEKEMT